MMPLGVGMLSSLVRFAVAAMTGLDLRDGRLGPRWQGKCSAKRYKQQY
jgi:hypothetical protein